MRQHGLSFDHNLHALRIVEDFELALCSISRIESDVRGPGRHHQAFARLRHVQEHPELAEYLLDQRPPLEAQLIDLTDEIAYNTADLDDGYEAHLLTVEQIAENVDLFVATR